MVADGMHARTDYNASLAVLGAVIGSWLGCPLVDPIIGLLIGAAILFITWDATKSMWYRLMDAIDPEYLARAEQVIAGQMGVESLHRYCTATAPALHRPCTGARHLMGEVAAGETRCSTTGCWPGQP